VVLARVDELDRPFHDLQTETSPGAPTWIIEAASVSHSRDKLGQRSYRNIEPCASHRMSISAARWRTFASFVSRLTALLCCCQEVRLATGISVF
jgi:hypothetical protein